MSCYIKNLPSASKIRQKINQIERKEELITCLKECFL